MKRRFALFVASFALVLCLVPAVPVSAQLYKPFDKACQGLTAEAAKSTPACQTNGSDPLTGKNGILYKVSQILAFLAGVAAVIMIIIGGFMHVTASGDAGKAGQARKVITAAVIGLVVIAMGEMIVALAINIVN